MHDENDMYPVHSSMNRSTSSLPKQVHSTIRLNQFTLQFEDHVLESSYQALIHCRKKELWLRSLVPAAAFHVLFGMGDCLEHPPDNLLVTIPARVFLAVLQASAFVLVRWDLIRATELTMLFVSLANGIPTLLLYALQRTSLHQWDALFVVFGLSFYTIPKITPLGFVASLTGSCLTGGVYALLALVFRPPTESFESLLGLSYAFSVTGIFNTISYYSEYNARERFVLRRRLKSESITLAMSRINALPLDRPTPSVTRDTFISMLRSRSNAVHRGQTFSLGVFLWGFFTLGGWTSLPEPLKFVDEATGWAWFSHCAGVTAFLLIMTRQLQWLLVVPLVGSILLWMLSMTIPSYWIIISAHSVGYGLLFASIVVAMGVFSWFVCAWKELVSFVTRSCFLYPQLQVGLQTEYPLLVKIVSEYTAGMDPAIISSRDNSNQAVLAVTTGTSDISKPGSSISPRRRSVRNGNRQKPTTHASGPIITSQNELEHVDQHALTVRGPEDASIICEKMKMVSVLPSFTADKCFFCSKNEANHLIPVCGTWGKWTHWRMSQVQQQGMETPSSSLILRDSKVTMMCTSYYDVQGEKSQLEQHIAVLETENLQLRQAVEMWKKREQCVTESNVQLQASLRALEEKRVMEQQRQAAREQDKVECIRRDLNKVIHAHKVELRRYTEEHKRLVSELETQRRIQDESRVKYENSMKEIEMLRAQLVALTSRPLHQSSVPASPVNTDNTLPVQQSRRLPYARWIEIEGLRESVRAKTDKKY